MKTPTEEFIQKQRDGHAAQGFRQSFKLQHRDKAFSHANLNLTEFGAQNPLLAERLSLGFVSSRTGCWEWQGKIGTRGYASITYQGRTLAAHKAAYMVWIGEVKPGLHCDHLCRNKICMNPLHIEPVTPRINTLRGVSPVAINAAKTICKRGHPLYGENLAINSRGERNCKTCDRDRQRVKYWSKRNEKR